LDIPSSTDAWDGGAVGQAGEHDWRHQPAGPRAMTLFADWTDRIALARCGQRRPGPSVSSATSSSRSGWRPKAYLHDEVSTDRRHPSVNANGPIYGALELSADYLPVLDPARTRRTAST